MPLSKKKNKDRMRDIRATCVQPNPVRPVQPKQAKLAELRKLMATVQPKESVQPIPLYNPSIHRPGDRVMIKPPYSKRLVETVIPELDDDGNPMT